MVNSLESAVQLLGLIFHDVAFSSGDCGEEMMKKLCSATACQLRVTNMKKEIIDSDSDSLAAAALPATEEQPHIQSCRMLLNVSDVKYNQSSISTSFRDGKPLAQLVKDFNDGRQHPLQMRSLNVVEWPGRVLFTLDHKRLWCLRMHGLAFSKPFQVWADVYRFLIVFEHMFQSHSIMDEFMRKYSTRNFGQSVELRGPPGSGNFLK